MSKITRIDPGEIYRGKANQSLEWGGITFQFPFSNFLPEPKKEVIDAFRDDIFDVGIREPIQIIIPKRFHHHGKAPVSTKGTEPPIMLKIENNRLKLVHRKGAKSKKAQRMTLPIVIVVNGEIRLRFAISLGIPLKDIPVMLYTDPPSGRDDQFKTLLKNRGERDRYDAMPDESKRMCRFVLDLWKTSTVRRGSMSDDGYSRMMLTVDKMFDNRFTRMSHRKMADLMGTNRNKVKQLRLAMGREWVGVDSGKFDKLRKLHTRRDAISSAGNRVREVRSEMEFSGVEMKAIEASEDAYESYVESILGFTDKQIETIEAEIDRIGDEGYDQAVKEGMGALEALFVRGKTVSKMMDEIIDVSSEIDYSDLFIQKNNDGDDNEQLLPPGS